MSWSVSRWQRVGGLEQRFGDRIEALPRAVATLRQVHGRRIHHLDDASEGSEGDGLVTDRPTSVSGPQIACPSTWSRPERGSPPRFTVAGAAARLE
jgi:hypothetical protein